MSSRCRQQRQAPISVPRSSRISNGMLLPRAADVVAPSGGEDGADDELVAVDLDQSESACVADGEDAGGEAEDVGGVGAHGGVESRPLCGPTSKPERVTRSSKSRPPIVRPTVTERRTLTRVSSRPGTARAIHSGRKESPSGPRTINGVDQRIRLSIGWDSSAPQGVRAYSTTLPSPASRRSTAPEPRGRGGGRRAGWSRCRDAIDQVTVAGGGDEELADDQQVPPVADDPERLGEPAVRHHDESSTPLDENLR